MSELQHPESRSFESIAEVYERVRPGYPKAAVSWLAEKLPIDSRTIVLDLGAGTGKLTRELLPFAGRVIALEPGPAMLTQLERAVPGAEPLLGAAEAIPLDAASVDAVVCGQSFHWFRHGEALAEIRRVLKPGGRLGLIWNLRDDADEFQREVTTLFQPFVPEGRKGPRESVAPLVAPELVGEVENAVFPFQHELDADGVVDRMSSTSFVASAPDSVRRAFFASLRAAVAARGGRVAFRYRTEVYVTAVA